MHSETRHKLCLLGLGPNNQQGVWSKVVAKVKWGGAALILGQTQFTVILSRSPSARLQSVTQLKHNLEKPAKPSLIYWRQFSRIFFIGELNQCDVGGPPPCESN